MVTGKNQEIQNRRGTDEKSDDEFEKLYYTLTYKCPKEKDELIELRKELFNFLEGEHSEEQKRN